MKKHYSIRRYLTLNITLWVLTMTVVPATWVYFDTSREVEELFDASLAQSARVLHGMIHRDTIEKHQDSITEALLAKETDAHAMVHDYEKKVSFQVIDKTGLILRSASAPDYPEVGLEEGYSYHEIYGYEWRIFSHYSKEDDWYLVVGERMDVRDELIHDIAVDHAIPLLFFTPFFIFIVNLVIRRGLKPLDVIAEDVKRKEYNNLEKLEYKKEPEEVSGLVTAINELFHSLSVQYDRERRFSSDAAHELRTPLAGLMIHTENLLEENQDAAMDASIISMKRGIHRLSHLVAQLLALSRAESQAVYDEFENTDMQAIARSVFRDLKPLAEQKGQTLSFDLPTDSAGNTTLKGSFALLYTMLSNVVNNAIKYCPVDTHIRIILAEDGSLIRVEDNGPGIPEDFLQRVKDRFFRMPHTKAEGSGLGLAIVERIALIHNLTWNLGNVKTGGLYAEFKLPD